jgi:hypothetical protein
VVLVVVAVQQIFKVQVGHMPKEVLELVDKEILGVQGTVLLLLAVVVVLVLLAVQLVAVVMVLHHL